MNKPVSIVEALTAAFASASADAFKVDGVAGELDALFAPASDAAKRKRKQRARAATGEAFEPMTHEERKAKRDAARAAKKQAADDTRLAQVAVLDMETDPFDGEIRSRIAPFTCCIYSDQFDTIEIWDEDEEGFVSRVLAAIESLPGKFTIYAHNGGKFDFMFLIKRLRGKVMFKGRGLMTANVGPHELRDSHHLIPDKLAAYRKEAFEYWKNRKEHRNNWKEEILAYQRSDCIFLFEVVKNFLTQYGFKISIGQAALTLLKREYPEIERISESTDTWLRGTKENPGFYFGGRVECLQGRGRFEGPYKLFDVNSMYPAVMVAKRHPVGRNYVPVKGEPGENTFFVDLNCYSEGAFPKKAEDGSTTFPHAFGRYKVSIYEYRVAIKHGLIRNVKINYVVNCDTATDFAKFVLPLYEMRQLAKSSRQKREEAGDFESEEYLKDKRDELFLKLILNNSYGKFCSNPRKYKEHFITDPGEKPDFEPGTWGVYRDGELWAEKPETRNSDYDIWTRPQKKRHYFNVGTGASITGAARAELLDVIMNADGPVYCDTDSLICLGLENVPLHKTELGAWDCEAEMEYIAVGGKKLYAYRGEKIKKPVIKAKGVAGVTFEEMEKIVDGEEILIKAKAPTLLKNGSQHYVDRLIKSTVEPANVKSGRKSDNPRKSAAR